MSEVGDVGGVDSAPNAGGPEPAGGVPEVEKREVAAETRAVSAETATAIGDDVVRDDDTFTATKREEPGVVEKVTDWIGQTAKGYATGAINTVLDTATMINRPINAGLNAVGVPYQFPTGLRLEPTSPAEANAQTAIELTTIASGVAGTIKAAPALTKLADNAVDATRSILGWGTASRTAVLGDLRPFEIAAIQNAVNLAKEDLYITGSAARGMRRNLDTDLPLGTFGQPKAGTRSDIDYAVRIGADDYVNGLSLKLPDLDPAFGIRGVDYINLQGGPAIRFSPFKAPELLPQGLPNILLK